MWVVCSGKGPLRTSDRGSPRTTPAQIDRVNLGFPQHKGKSLPALSWLKPLDQNCILCVYCQWTIASYKIGHGE